MHIRKAHTDVILHAVVSAIWPAFPFFHF